MIESERRQVVTQVPGEIVSYDAKTQTASVQPKLTQKYGDQSLKAPELIDIPVDHPRAGTFILHKPPKRGDPVVLNIPHRSQVDYNSEGKEVDGAPTRMFNLSDARATLTGHPTSKPAKNMPEKGVYFGTEDGKAGITISEDGKIDHKQENDSLYKVILAFMETVRDHTNEGKKHDQAGDVSKHIDRLKKLMG
jgi:hypothetical protein